MPHTPRIGIQIQPEDPFWVQVHEVMWRRAQRLAVDLVEVSAKGSRRLGVDEQIEFVEDLIVQELDAIISNAFSLSLLTRILGHGLPVVCLNELSLRHELLISREGLSEAGAMLGRFLGERLPGPARALIVGGLVEGEDNGSSRIDGFRATLPADGRIAVAHAPSDWTYPGAYAAAGAWLAANPGLQVDAIYGLSDLLTFAAREAFQACGRLGAGTLLLGVNGDPPALAAIADGSMAATVETDVDDIATQAVDLAYRAALGQATPATFSNLQRLVTAENVAEVAVRKLISLANLPARLVGVYERSEQQRVTQLETSTAIDQQVGHILDEQQLSLAITELIRNSYGFDSAQFLTWDAERRRLFEASRRSAAASLRPDPAGPLSYALLQNQVVFIPNTANSQRFRPDPLWPETRARVVVPVRLGGQIIGLLDLHRWQVSHYTREELDGLQLLADRLGITVRNAELYSQEIEARALAEQADRVKTTLLANVSHELRTPLNVILGYSRGALDLLARGEPGAEQLASDLTQIYNSGAHLLRLINDLLDLSRAEIGELDLLPEPIDSGEFLDSVFRAGAESIGDNPQVDWRLEIPPDLPGITADPVRLRQILFNLLHNAHKFTERGTITLGAELAGAELHLWVADTGPGVAPELRGQIFEPFVSAGEGLHRREGIGLGLNITRRLVALHGGRLSLDSELGAGSTFHIYLPLPAPAEPTSAAAQPIGQVLLLISAGGELPAPISRLAERRGLTLRVLRSGEDLAGALAAIRPALLAWDVSTAAEDGLRMIEEIRSRPELRQLPVMLYGGAADAGADAACITTGLLLKPLGDEALVSALSDLDPSTPDGSVLIVEDDPHVRAQHRRLIAQSYPGYSIRDVGDGQAALEAIADTSPSLIVLDLMMPGLDGFAVLEAIRRDRRSAEIPVLVLSGKVLDSEDIRRLNEARTIFQAKNVLSTSELADTLRRALNPEERLPQQTSRLIKQAIAFVQHNYSLSLSRQAIADAVGVHKDYLGRIFLQEVGISPWEFLIRFRLLRARELLRESDLSIAEIAARVGFETPTYFSQVFNRQVGCSPRAYRARQRG